jgi:hypothetical protein
MFRTSFFNEKAFVYWNDDEFGITHVDKGTFQMNFCLLTEAGLSFEQGFITGIFDALW